MSLSRVRLMGVAGTLLSASGAWGRRRSTRDSLGFHHFLLVAFLVLACLISVGLHPGSAAAAPYDGTFENAVDGTPLSTPTWTNLWWQFPPARAEYDDAHAKSGTMSAWIKGPTGSTGGVDCSQAGVVSADGSEIRFWVYFDSTNQRRLIAGDNRYNSAFLLEFTEQGHIAVHTRRAQPGYLQNGNTPVGTYSPGWMELRLVFTFTGPNAQTYLLSKRSKSSDSWEPLKAQAANTYAVPFDNDRTSNAGMHFWASRGANMWIDDIRSSASGITDPTSDVTPPSAPAGVLVADHPNDLGTSLDLAWMPAIDDVGVVGYRIHRGVTSELSPLPFTLPASATSFTDETCLPEQLYFYAVSAIDAEGNESSLSPTYAGVTKADAGLLDVFSPGTPLDLAVADHPGDQGQAVDVSWSQSTDDYGVTGYKLYRGPAPGVYNHTVALYPTDTTYSDETCLAGTRYYYAVSAIDAAGNESPLSCAVEVTAADNLTPAFDGTFENAEDGTPLNLPMWLDTLNAEYDTARAKSGTRSAWLHGLDGAVLNDFGGGVYETASSGMSANGAEIRFWVYFDTTNQRRWIGDAAISDKTWWLTFNESGSITVKTDRTGFTGYPNGVETPIGTYSTGWTEYRVVLTSSGTNWRTFTLSRRTSSDDAWTPLKATGATGYSIPDVSMWSSIYAGTQFSVDQNTNLWFDDLRFSNSGISDGDTVAPVAPQALTASDRPEDSGTGVNLSWDAATDAVGVTGYKLYRRGATGGYSAPVTVAAGTSFTDETCAPSQRFYYAVSAVDAAGNESAKSSEVSIVTVDDLGTSPPTSPSGLLGTAGPSQVMLTWSANPEVDVIGYNLYRDGVKINTSPITGKSYADLGLTLGTTYSYALTAVDSSANEGAPSTAIDVTTLPLLSASLEARLAPSYPPRAPGFTYFGRYVDVDGSTVAVGDSFDGSVSVFSRSSDSWTESARIEQYQLSEIQLSGSDLSVGSDYGEAQIHSMSDGAWGVSLSASGFERLAIDGDVAVGFNGSAVQAFRRVSEEWIPIAEAPMISSGWYPPSIAMDGELVALFDPGAGIVHVFRVIGDDLVEQQQLPAIGSEDAMVALSGDTLVFSSPSWSQPIVDIYRLIDGAFRHEQTLQPGDVSPDSEWGGSVAIDGDTIVVGARRDTNTGSENVGSVTVYTRAGSRWFERLKIPSEAPPGDDGWGSLRGPSFGNRVAVDGQTLVVGAFQETIFGDGLGAAYVYRLSEGLGDVTPPTVPVDVQAVDHPDDGGEAIDLSWSASSDDVGVTGYKVYKGTSPGVYGIPIRLFGTGTQYTDRNWMPGVTYYYAVSARDASGNWSEKSIEVSAAGVDNWPPTAPHGLMATGGARQVDLRWDAHYDPDVVGYNVYRDGVKVNDAPITETEYTDSNVAEAATYSYTLTAVDLAGNESEQCAAVSATTVDIIPPAVPAGLSATGGANQVSLTWSANGEPDLVGYNLYRDGVKVNDVPVTGTEYTDTDVAQATTYSYALAAVDSAGNESAQGTGVSATTTDTSAPSAPASLLAVDRPADDGTAIDLSWPAATDNVGVVGYRLYRGTAPGVYGAPTTLLATNYSDETVVAGTVYYYAVAAVDAAGNEGAKSDEVIVEATDDSATAPPADAVTFEEGTDGAALPWLPIGGPQHLEYDSARARSGSMSAWIQGPASAVNGGAAETASGGLRSNGAEQRFWIYLDTADQARIFEDYAPGVAVSDRATFVQFSSDGKINVWTDRTVSGYTKGGWTGVGAYDTGWTQVRVAYSFTAQTYTLSTRRSSTDPWTPLKATQASGFGIPFRGTNTITTTHGQLFRGFQGANLWLDDIRYADAVINTKPAVAAGMDHTVGLRADGTVVATGQNSDGRCDVSNWSGIVAVAAGSFHTVGVKADGTVVSTGRHTEGQRAVTGWRDIRSVSAGAFHTVGLRVDGTVVATGSNLEGQCDVSAWTDVVAVSAAGYQTIGLRADGTVLATGKNDIGQCDVSDWSGAVAVSAGMYHTVALRADGRVLATGRNNDGQANVSDWTGISAISAGWYHTIGLKPFVSVVAVGDNSPYGQCNVSGWTNVVAVSAGGHHSVGMTSTGAVLATGSNASGQCDVNGWDLDCLADAQDHTPPTRPTELVASDHPEDAGTAVDLQWFAAKDDRGVIGYKLYRGTSPGLYEPAILLTAATSYRDNTCVAGTRYYYAVSAVDAAGNESVLSPAASVVSTYDFPLAAPRGVSAVPGARQVVLSWTANAETDLMGYNLYRNGVRINSAPVVVNSYTDSALEELTTYSYRITAVNTSGGESAPSGAVSATTPGTPTTGTLVDAGFENGIDGEDLRYHVWMTGGSGDPLNHEYDSAESKMGSQSAYIHGPTGGDGGVYTEEPGGMTADGAELRFWVKFGDNASDHYFNDDPGYIENQTLGLKFGQDGNLYTFVSGDSRSNGYVNGYNKVGTYLAGIWQQYRVVYNFTSDTFTLSVRTEEGDEWVPLKSSGAAGFDIPMLGSANIKQNRGIGFYLRPNSHMWIDDLRYSNSGMVDLPPVVEPPADTTPPSAPASLSAIDHPNDTGTAIDLSWSAASDDVGVVGYRLYRGTSAGVYGAPTALPGSATSYTDETVVAGTTYHYAISAIDAAGNEGAKSPEASVTAVDDSEPEPPAPTADVTFEEGTDGAALPWTPIGGPQRLEYDNAVAKTGSMSAWIKGPATAVNGGAVETASGGLRSNGAEQRFWIYLDTTNEARIFEDYAPGVAVADRPTFVQFSSDGKINVWTDRTASGYTKGAWTSVGTYQTGWTEVRVAYTFTGSGSQTYTLSTRRGETDAWTQLKAAGASTYGIPFRGTNTITTTHGQLFRGFQGADLWLDDMRFSDTPISDTPVGPPADTAAPSAPASLLAVDHPNDTGTAIDLSWSAASDNVGVVGYRLYRGTSPGTYGAPVTLLGSGTTRTDEAVVAGTTYYYAVAAIDAAGNEGAKSPEASVVAVDDSTEPPGLPALIDFENGVDGTSLGSPWTISTLGLREPQHAEYDGSVAKNGSMSAWIQGPTDATANSGIREAVSAGMTANGAELRVWVYCDTTTQRRVIYGYGTSAPTYMRLDDDGMIKVRTVRAGDPNGYTTNSYVPVGTYQTGWTEYRIIYDFDGPSPQTYTLSMRRSETDPWTPLKAANASNYDIPFWRDVTITQTSGMCFDGVGPTNLWLDDYSFSETGFGDSTEPPADTTPPSAPASLSAVDHPADDGTAIDVSWSAATDDVGVTGYKLYRGTSPGVYGTAVTLLGTSTTHTDETVVAGNTYYYAVAAIDAAGNEGAKSPEASVTAVDDSEPEPPLFEADITFEEGSDGAALPWQAIGGPQRLEYDSTRARTGSMSAWIQGPAGAVNGGAVETASGGLNANGAEQRFWIYLDSANQARIFEDYAPGVAVADRATFVQFSADGKINVWTDRTAADYTKGAWTSVGTYTTGWTEVRVTYQFTGTGAQTYTLSTRRGETDAWTQLKAAGASTYGIPFRGTNAITTTHGQLFRGFQGANLWLDDIRFSNGVEAW